MSDNGESKTVSQVGLLGWSQKRHWIREIISGAKFAADRDMAKAACGYFGWCRVIFTDGNAEVSCLTCMKALLRARSLEEIPEGALL
ncbi:MAG: hypothetical protein LBR20_02175 [Propionibacteriaceae bacterium]|jgi:hypothetical protein|nr:hypothetical protein [Propionibacteriaceae bacterium]